VNYQKLLGERLSDWRPDEVGTLMFVVQETSVLLIRKKRGHGAGKINGPGGKLEDGENPLSCAVRETFEEVGITAHTPELLGEFKFVDLVAPQWLGYAFLARSFHGIPKETEEAVPLWFEFDRIPYAEMWPDDRHWLPLLLAGKKVTGEFLFDDGRLLAHRLR